MLKTISECGQPASASDGYTLTYSNGSGPIKEINLRHDRPQDNFKNLEMTNYKIFKLYNKNEKKRSQRGRHQKWIRKGLLGVRATAWTSTGTRSKSLTTSN